MTDQTSLPFSPADETTPAADPVQQAVIGAREAYRASVADAHPAWEKRSIDAWDKSELQRRSKFIADWKDDHPWSSEKPIYKYADWDDESVFRDMQDPATRPARLLDARLYRQYLKCMLVRAGGTASIAQVKSWLAPHIPVDGEHVIRPNDAELANLIRKGRPFTTTYAENLSAELYQILTASYMVRVGLGGRVEFDWRAEHNDRSSW
jgi:hypothetical protein